MDNLPDDPGTRFGMVIGGVYRAMLRRLGRRFATAGYNVTPEQWSVLLHLWRADGPSQQTLADLTDRDKPTIARMVDVLEKRGLVTRTSHQSDGRIKQVFLTESGQAARAGLLAGSRVALEGALSGIEPGELSMALSVLERMRANLESLSSEDASHANQSIPRVVQAAEAGSEADP
ncbi:MAG TPA: MarR family winged helix-turn-helix transcriptional regulator [Thermoflexales bacterium]|nr:winged helix-turn-helix transcriptional regulator [Anaerolineae bacterium]HQV28801.1 MarR family winged helix-turn-helix transcriptional regulator [Thermoflexales bacterium]HQX11952.1 MarR family winged helix-turn-helix transcriptional regulator [Thermoflexales bacterium]HQY24910.1 MarR family winged helix-turn-helix transcriptional regulator [Thermoflexales bacterium]HQZ54037.1 MarR family winged helix-turn-helix transcriptional regulator [Thermoflexales bacterium]